jgi:hypothetical protein
MTEKTTLFDKDELNDISDIWNGKPTKKPVKKETEPKDEKEDEDPKTEKKKGVSEDDVLDILYGRGKKSDTKKKDESVGI